MDDAKQRAKELCQAQGWVKYWSCWASYVFIEREHDSGLCRKQGLEFTDMKHIHGKKGLLVGAKPVTATGLITRLTPDSHQICVWSISAPLLVALFILLFQPPSGCVVRCCGP